MICSFPCANVRPPPGAGHAQSGSGPMAPKLIITSESRGIDDLLDEFSFLYDGKAYKVTAKEGRKHKLDEFYRFIKFTASKKGINPFTFRNWKDNFDVDRVGTAPGAKKPKEPEQMRLKLARKMELIALELEEKGLGRCARMLKPLAMGCRRGWLGPKSIGFFDDVSNIGIQPDEAVSVVDAYEGGATEDELMAKATEVEPGSCRKVIGLAKKHNLVS